MAKYKLSKETKKAVKAERPVVKAGQLWIDNDKRHGNRREVKTLPLPKTQKGKKDPIWTCEVFMYGKPTGRTVKIKQSRFKPTSTGYRLSVVNEQTMHKRPEDTQINPVVDDPVQEPGFGDGKTYENITVKPVAVEIEVPVPWAPGENVQNLPRPEPATQEADPFAEVDKKAKEQP